MKFQIAPDLFEHVPLPETTTESPTEASEEDETSDENSEASDGEEVINKMPKVQDCGCPWVLSACFVGHSMYLVCQW